MKIGVETTTETMMAGNNERPRAPQTRAGNSQASNKGNPDAKYGKTGINDHHYGAFAGRAGLLSVNEVIIHQSATHRLGVRKANVMHPIYQCDTPRDLTTANTVNNIIFMSKNND